MKNFSTNNRGNRIANDLYETPYSMSQQILDKNLFDKSKMILEPACGGGAIVKVLQANNFENIVHYDRETDFLKEENPYPQLLTNPPFKHAQQFILKAKEIVTERFALLLPLNYLHGKKRFDQIFSDKSYGLKAVYVFTRYALLGEKLRPDGKYKAGMMVYAWYFWENGYSGSPSIDWLDNHEFIARF